MNDSFRHPLIQDRRMARVSLDPRFLGQLIGSWLRGEIVMNGRRVHLKGLPDDAVFGEAAMNPLTWTVDVVVASASLPAIPCGEHLPNLALTEFTEELVDRL